MELRLGQPCLCPEIPRAQIHTIIISGWPSLDLCVKRFSRSLVQDGDRIEDRVRPGNVFTNTPFVLVALWIILATSRSINVQNWCWKGKYKLMRMFFEGVELYLLFQSIVWLIFSFLAQKIIEILNFETFSPTD